MTDILARQRQLIGTTAEWGADDLVLGSGEIAVERVSATEIKIKIGDGVSRFSTLPYVAGGTTGGSGLQLTGGTLSGPLVLPAGAPTGRQAVSKEEADKLYVLVSSLIAASAGAASAGSVPKLNAAGKIDASFLSITGTMSFKGTANVTAAVPAGITSGDYYVTAADAVAGAGWTGIVGQSIKAGDALLYDGAKWHAMPQNIDLAAYLKLTGGTLSGSLVVPVGTAAAPSVASVGDLDTGVYFPAADQVGITAGGAERAKFSSTGLAVTGALSATGNITATGGTITTGSTTALSLATRGGVGLLITDVASLVNSWQFSGSGAGSSIYAQATGKDTDISVFVGSKGAGHISLHTAGGSFTEQVRINHTAAADRYITLTGSNGGNPTIGTSAGDLAVSTNITVGGRAINAPVAANNGAFNLALKNNFTCTPVTNVTLTFSNFAAGQSGIILLKNAAGKAISAAATTKVDGGFLAKVSAAGTYLLTYFSDGTNAYVVASGDLK
jgi:hypothetical protein